MGWFLPVLPLAPQPHDGLGRERGEVARLDLLGGDAELGSFIFAAADISDDENVVALASARQKRERPRMTLPGATIWVFIEHLRLGLPIRPTAREAPADL
jgi:hypothetical protein